jgi:hypothetical protein
VLTKTNAQKKEKIMPLNDSQKIKINTVTGGKDKDDLKKCFFYPAANNTYDFYKKEDGVETLLQTGITTGTPFTFTLDNYNWTVPNPKDPNSDFSIDAQNASGSWKNNDDGASIEAQSTGESGTFQGQTGTSADPEDASTATA